MTFFYYESKFNFFWGGEGLGWRGGGGARVSELFFSKNPNLKKKI